MKPNAEADGVEPLVFEPNAGWPNTLLEDGPVVLPNAEPDPFVLGALPEEVDVGANADAVDVDADDVPKPVNFEEDAAVLPNPLNADPPAGVLEEPPLEGPNVNLAGAASFFLSAFAVAPKAELPALGLKPKENLGAVVPFGSSFFSVLLAGVLPNALPPKIGVLDEVVGG